MSTRRYTHKYFYIALLLPVIMLPGCGFIDWIKNKFGKETKGAEQVVDFSSPMTNISCNDTSEILVTIKGKPAITVKTFERDFELLLEENPQLKSVLPFMPDARKNFLGGLVNQEVVDLYVQQHNLDKKVEYKQDLERLQRSVVRMLNTKYFAAAHPVSVEEAEVASYYENNKDKMQELVISRGGVQTSGVQFEKEAEAKAFFTKVQGKSLQAIAKVENITDKVKDFKLVNKQSVGIDPVLRSKIVAFEKVPTTELVKVNDKTFWVVQATSKEDAKYRSFEEVKEPIKQLVEREKSNEALQKVIEGLKQDMQVAVNYDYFKQSEASTQEEQQVVIQQEQGNNKPVQQTQASQVVATSRAA